MNWNILKMKKYLEPSEMVDSDHLTIKDCANRLTAEESGNISMAVKLYYFVRDGIQYDPYTHFHKAKYYKSSRILKVRRGNCICKATLLCALSRAVGIPSRLAFADVRNHLATKQLIEFIGSNIFLFHGYTELYLNGKWVVATPAFNSNLCKLHHVEPLDFDGYNDSIFQLYSSDNDMYMEYLTHHGSFDDVPLDKILLAWKEGYGETRVMGWINEIEKKESSNSRNFYQEDKCS